MAKTGHKVILLERRRKRVRKHITGTTKRPRVSVYRSLKHIYAQIVDDSTGQTLVAASSLALKVPGGNVEAAKAVGKALAEKAREKAITQVCFDRGGRLYHGRVKALADAAREAGLQF
jgi:large subunit ribosomal protein L18